MVRRGLWLSGGLVGVALGARWVLRPPAPAGALFVPPAPAAPLPPALHDDPASAAPVDDVRAHAFRLPSGDAPGLTCEQARQDIQQIRTQLAYSPEPVSPFVDAFVIGEGEEVVHEIAGAVLDWKQSGGSRRELLWRLTEIPGVYVPAFFDFRYSAAGPIEAIIPLKPGYEKITRRIVPDLNLVPHPDRPILPFMHTVHDRLPLEIQRGCTRSCRFCQVGMITRPTRQRDPAQVMRFAEQGLANTGYEQVGFLSLSAGDYQALNPMLEDFFARFEADQIAVGLPSLRTETMNDRLAAQIKRVRKTGFTMAPEAASERMRRVINKGNQESDLLRAADSVYRAGWEMVKL